MSYSSRLKDLAHLIDARATPLGADFSTGCWGAEAARIAAEHGEDPCAYYGFSREIYQGAIKRNEELPPTARNSKMSAITLQLAQQATS